MELEIQVTPSTPQKVLEERIKTIAKDAKIIEEVEALCAKVVDQFSQTWESLIDEYELEKIIEQLHTGET